MTARNPLHRASTARQMARSAPASDTVLFNRLAMVCMAAAYIPGRP